MTRIIEFQYLPSADLIVDAVYKEGSVGGTGDDPLTKLLDAGIKADLGIGGLQSHLICSMSYYTQVYLIPIGLTV